MAATKVIALKVTVPPDGEAGQLVYFKGPVGEQLQAQVPEDKKPGDESEPEILRDVKRC